MTGFGIAALGEQGLGPLTVGGWIIGLRKKSIFERGKGYIELARLLLDAAQFDIIAGQPLRLASLRLVGNRLLESRRAAAR